jgi:hypothetical protein
MPVEPPGSSGVEVPVVASVVDVVGSTVEPDAEFVMASADVEPTAEPGSAESVVHATAVARIKHRTNGEERVTNAIGPSNSGSPVTISTVDVS